KSFPFAIAWYQKALALGGPGVDDRRKDIDQFIAEIQAEMKANPETGPDGEDIGEGKTLYQQAEIAYAEHDDANAEALYKEAYERSNTPQMLFNIGQTCRHQNKYAEAKYWYREYLEKDPSSPLKADVERMIEEMKEKAPDPPDLTST